MIMQNLGWCVLDVALSSDRPGPQGSGRTERLDQERLAPVAPPPGPPPRRGALMWRERAGAQGPRVPGCESRRPMPAGPQGCRIPGAEGEVRYSSFYRN